MWWTVWPASSCVVCLRLGAGEDSLLTMPMDADYKKPCRKPILCSQKKKDRAARAQCLDSNTTLQSNIKKYVGGKGATISLMLTRGYM